MLASRGTHLILPSRRRHRNERSGALVHTGDGSFFQPDTNPYAYYTVTSSRTYDRRTGRLLHETHDPIHISPQLDERGIVSYSIETTNPREDPDRLAFFENVVNTRGGSSVIRHHYDAPTSSHHHQSAGTAYDYHADGAYRSDDYDSSFDNEGDDRRRTSDRDHSHRWREDR